MLQPGESSASSSPPRGPQGSGAQPRRSLARHLSELQVLLDQAPSFLALTQGPEHVLAIVNQAYLELVGRARDDVVGKPILEAIPELKRQGLGSLLEEVIESRQQRTGSAVRVMLPGAPGAAVQERRVDFILQPIFDATNQTVGIFIQGLDVTDRELAVEALRQADRNKDDFLAKLAHEMLNPLAASRVALELLGRKLASSPADIDHVLAVLRRQQAALSALVEDLLDVSRIKLGKLTLSIEPVDLHDVVSAAVETCRHQIEAKSHELRLVLSSRPLSVMADRRRLVQVVTNLLVNAAKFTGPSGVITVRFGELPDAADITVADSGKGMSAQEMQQAFELFHQNTEEDKRLGGMGIGLGLVRQLVELQGGVVWAESPGASQGTSITVRLPRARP